VLRSAFALAERTPGAGPFGDFATVCYTYLATLARKRGRVRETQRCAERGLAAATAHQMSVYLGMAQAHLAWGAWRQGGHVEAQTHGQVALACWQGVQYPFRWAALWPLLGVAHARGQIGDAIRYARDLLAPLQQSPPAPLRGLVDQAVQAWDASQSGMAARHLAKALEMAQEAGYS
jgi:hypothetical protein